MKEKLASALAELVRATFHMCDTSPSAGDAFPKAHIHARAVLMLYQTTPADPAAEFLSYLERELTACSDPRKREFLARLQGSVRKLTTL